MNPQDWVRIGAPLPEEQALSLQQQIKAAGLEARRKTLPEGVVVLVRRERLSQAREILRPEPEHTTGGRFGLIAAGATLGGAAVGAPLGFVLRGTMIASAMASVAMAFCAFLMVLAFSAPRAGESAVSQTPQTQTTSNSTPRRTEAEERRKD